MLQILPFVQLGIGVLLAAAILIQQRGESLGSSFGGSGAIHTSRRGAEKKLFYATIVLAVLFALSALAQHLQL